ncbi:plasmid stabilization protein [Pseudomonas hormoni]|uniref:Plasmid stabilization protein n=1 Tax=Pseudomonas hormoni TaxID=3093767 RepID=A0ABX8EZ95_9PSED|nr:plasmid stabilization protein [Pseudomonas hormoni]QVW24043.1 plasmid stabilization protein [Pseudomonas hormoni]
MASITIGNLDQLIYEQLQIAADSNCRSVVEEALFILKKALDQDGRACSLGTRINNRFRENGGTELDLPLR